MALIVRAEDSSSVTSARRLGTEGAVETFGDHPVVGPHVGWKKAGTMEDLRA
jgi:hypothetical protein